VAKEPTKANFTNEECSLLLSLWLVFLGVRSFCPKAHFAYSCKARRLIPCLLLYFPSVAVNDALNLNGHNN